MTEKGYIYLIHFERPIAHAQHYLGAARNLEQRIAHHLGGRGARLMAAATQREIRWWLTRLWETKDGINPYHVEGTLKTRKRRGIMCPLCYGEAAMRRGLVSTCNGDSGEEHPLIAKINSEILGVGHEHSKGG